MQRFRVTICFLFLFLLSACLPAQTAGLPTLAAMPITLTPFVPTLARVATSSPTQEILVPTAEPAANDTPGSFPQEEFFTETPTVQPSLNPALTQTATAVPQPSTDAGVIQLLGPGPLSKIVSPMVVYGYSLASLGTSGRIELFGEDGRLLASQQLFLETTFKWSYYYQEIKFKASAVGELGKLTISIQDQRGRMTAAYSVLLFLLSDGEAIVNPPGDLREHCLLEQPVADKNVSGGLLTVTGKMRPFNPLPLTVELVTKDGSILAAQTVSMAVPAGDDYVPFQVDLSYTVPFGTQALLIVTQTDNRIGGTMYLYSREIFLNR